MFPPRALCAAVCLMLLLTGTTGAQIVTVASGLSGSSHPVSPSVVASYVFSTGPAGIDRLELLALWRGRSNWYAAAGSGGASKVGNNSYSSSHRNGDRVLNLELIVDQHAAIVQGQRLDLRQGNVFLIDNVDGTPAVVGSLLVEAWLGPSTSQGSDRLLPVLALRQVREFLRCEDAVRTPSVFGNPCLQLPRE